MRILTSGFLLTLWLCAACASPTRAPAATALPGVATGTAPAVTPSALPVPPTSRPTVAAATAPATSTAPAALTAAPTVAATLATPATATANPTVAGGLVGLWQGNNNSYYLFNIDGTWNWDQKRELVLTAPENQGRWWVEGDVFNLQDLSGKAPCPPKQIGAYQAQLSGDTLVLTLVKDDCGPRIDQTAGQYSRQPAGP